MATKKATTSISTWDWQTRHVQNELEVGQFTHGKHTLLCAGPPRLLNMGILPAAAGTDDVLSMNRDNLAFPIGTSNSFTLRSDKPWRPVYEIGSDRAYMLPGHAAFSGTIGRVFYNGPSLLKVLYAYYGKRFNANSKFGADQPEVAYDLLYDLPEVYEAPGFGDLFLNLQSDLFDQLMGLLVIFQDSKRQTVGAIYLEETAVNGHTMSIDAESPMLVEGCGLMPTRVVPVDIKIQSSVQRDLVWSV